MKHLLRSTWIAGTVALLAATLSAVWLSLTPLFAEPDEQAHFDYALTLVREGWPVQAGSRKTGTDVDPLLAYFERVVAYRELRFDASRKVAVDYGTRAWRARVDREAPSPGQLVTNEVPYVARSYPAGFYLIGAMLYRLARTAGFGPFESISFARALGTLLLPTTLLLAFNVFRRAGGGLTRALLATSIVALFPLTTWVSASFQPDTLTTTCVTAALLLAILARDRPRDIGVHVAFGVVCGSIAFVKIHYGLIAYVGLFPALVSGVVRRPGLRSSTAFTLAALIPLGFFAAAVGSMPHMDGATAPLSLRHVADFHLWIDELKSIYLSGIAHDTFWTSRDWIDTAFFPESVLGSIRIWISCISLVAFALVLLQVARTLLRLRKIAGRHRRVALALALGDAPLTLYATWTIALIALDLSVTGRIGLLGRYWLPVLVPLVSVTMRYLGRLAIARLRGRVATSIGLAWLAYAVVAAPFALTQVTQRFFGPARARLTTDRYVSIDSMYDSTSGVTFDTTAARTVRGDVLCFRGLAIDSRFGLPARAVALRVDGIDYPLHYGIARVDPANIFRDDVLRNIGFAGCLETARYAEGDHEARLIVVAQDRTPLTWPRVLRLTIDDPTENRASRGISNARYR